MKSKVSSVLPGGSFASAQCRSRRRRSRSATSWLASAASRRAVGHPSRSARSVKLLHGARMVGRRSLLEQHVELGRVHNEAVAEEGALGASYPASSSTSIIGGEPGFAALLMG